MVKVKRNYIITMLIVCILTLSLLMTSIAIFGNKNQHHDSDISTSGMTNIDIVDENGKVETPTTEGVAISNTQQLKDFLTGSEPKGYLTNNITDFKWEKESNDRHGASTIEFAKGRVLDGNGYTVTVSQSDGLTDQYPMLTRNRAVKMYWTGGVRSSSGAVDGDIYAASFFIAVNQGTIKNLNMDAKVTGTLEWVASGTRNKVGDTGARSANSVPLFFGFMTGVNFGIINNSTINYSSSSNFNLSNGNDNSTEQWAKEEKNDVEVGCMAGVNVGEISYVTGVLDGTIGVTTRASNKYSSGVGSGNASARSIFGMLIGRMQSDPMADRNQVGITTASLTNSIIAGSGRVASDASKAGSGVAYSHTGAAVGSNSPYSGTVVNPNRGQSYGIIDGIFSKFVGTIGRTTSGGAPSQNYRAIVDCGKISNVMFADAYDGHIDNCGCVGGEHIATRANGIKTSYGNGNLSVKFSREDTSNASWIFDITTIAPDANKIDDNIIFAITKRDRVVKNGSSLSNSTSVALFNYESDSFYSQFSDTVKQTSKRAIIEIVEPRTSSDTNSFILDLEFGTQVKAMYETVSTGKYYSYDEKLARDIETFSYDGAEKGVAKIVSLNDNNGEDSFAEKMANRVFKSKYRTENENVVDAKDFTMDLVYPGVYTNIYIQAAKSAKHAYLDDKDRVVAPLEKNNNGDILTKEFKITPAFINAKSDDQNIIIGGEGANKNDIDTSKLFATTYASFGFDFTLYILDSAGNRQELRKSISGSGANQVVTFPYDRIEYSDDGYVYKTALTFEQFESGQKFIVNRSTHPINGRNYYFRGIKELKNSSGVTVMTTAITLESQNYKIKIDGEEPVISAKITSGTNAGIDFMSWSERNAWKKEAFTLEFNVFEATVDGITFYKKFVGANDTEGTAIALDNFKATETFSDGNEYVFYAFDKYGNRSTDYAVSSKVDNVTPEFELVAGITSYDNGGILKVDDVDVTQDTAVLAKAVADRTLVLNVNITQAGASGTMVYYKLNGSDWSKLSDNQIVLDKVIDSSYYNNDGTVDKNVFDKIQIKVVSGALNESISDIEYYIQVNKGVVLVDKDKVSTPNGFFVTQGIRREHVTKTYTSTNNLSASLIEVLTGAINKELKTQYGVEREQKDAIKVDGYYATANVGNNIPITLIITDPLDVYTINPNLLQLEGYIAPANVNVVVNSATREYGRPNPKFTYTVSGLLGADTIDLSNLISTPEEVNLETPVNRNGINLVVPSKGIVFGNYRIADVNAVNAKLYITPQELINVTYDDSYLDLAYNGLAHSVKGTYKTPNGIVKNLEVKYYNANGELIDEVIDIGMYKAVFSIADTNYVLSPTRATINFEVHKGYVDIKVSNDELNIKYNGKERPINPVLSNGSIPKVTYYDSAHNLMFDGVNGFYPTVAGKYTVFVEYNNDLDQDPTKVGKFYNNIVQLDMIINKVAIAESGIKWENVVKKYDGKKSQVIVSDIMAGTQIPEGLVPGEEEGSYILLEATAVGEYSKSYAFKNPNIIEQELVASIIIEKAVFDDYGVKFDSLSTTFNNEYHKISIDNLPEGINVNIKLIQGTTPGLVMDIDGKSLTRKEAGVYKVKLELSNENFVTKILESKLTIEKAKFTTAKSEPVIVKYDEKGHYAIISGVPSDVDMDAKTVIDIIFAGGDTNKYQAVPLNAERTIWRTPIKTESGGYNFRAIINNANYEAAAAVEGQFSIEKTTYKDFGTKARDINVTYDGTVKTLELENVPIGTKYLDELGNEISGVIKATNAGIYTLNVYLSNPNIIDLINPMVATLNIAKKQNTNSYVLDGVTTDYNPNNDLEVVFDNSQLAEGFTVEFNQLDGMIIKDNVLVFANAGTYNVVGYIVNANYEPAKISATVVVNKISAPYAGNVVVNDQNVVYSGSAQNPKVDGLDASYGATVGYSYSGSIIIGNAPTNVGKYNAKVTISHKNYITIVKDIVFTIEPANIKDTGYYIDTASVVYNGETHSVNVLTASGVPVSGFMVKLTYGDLGEGVLPVNAGSYVVKGVLSKPNYNDLEIAVDGLLDIRKAESGEISVRDVTGKFTGKTHKIVVTNADGSALTDYTALYYKDGKLLENGIVNAGNYSCVVVISQKNYVSKSVTINVNIEAKAVDITYGNVDKPVVDNKFVLTGTYKDISGKEQQVVFVYPEDFKGAPGKYTIGVRIADENYVVTSETSSVDIEIKGENIGAIAGGSAGGVAAVGIGVGLFFVLKKKKVSL